jgi:hypothetical protein
MNVAGSAHGDVFLDYRLLTRVADGRATVRAGLQAEAHFASGIVIRVIGK